MKNSLGKQPFKFGIIVVVLVSIVPLLAQQLLSSPSAPTNITVLVAPSA